MGPDITFFLRANTASFTKGLANANNQLHDLKKTVREGDLGMGIKRFLGAGAIIEGFRMAIDKARELRQTAEETGRSIDASTRTVAAFGDGISSVFETAKEWSVTGVGWFTQMGDAIGSVLVGIKEGSMQAGYALSEISAQTEKDAKKQEARRDAAYKKNAEANTPEALAALDKRIAKSKHDAELLKMSDAEKVNELYNEQIQLQIKLGEQQKALAGGTLLGGEKAVKETEEAFINKKIEAAKAQKDFSEKQAALELDKKNAERALADAKANLLNPRLDPFLPSIEELSLTADYNRAGDPKRADAGDRARKMFKLQEDAGYAFGRGDKERAVSMLEQASQIRAGLGGFAKSTDVNSERNAAEAVDKATDQLVKVNDKLSDIFVLKGK